MKKLLLILFIFICSFGFSQGVWSPRTSFPDSGYSEGISGFSIGNYGYAGLGTYSGASINFDDFWQFNASNNKWTKKANFTGKARISPASFVIGSKAYLVTGSEYNAGPCTTECWQYDTITGAWTQKANFPGSARVYAVGFAIDNKGYVGTGANELRDFRKDFYEYDTAGGGSWTQVADFGGIARDGACGFAVNGKGYVCFGQDSTINNYNDIWEYDPVLNNWRQKSNYPGPGLLCAIGFTICNNIYVGSGDSTSAFHSDDHRFWKYNIVSGTWIQEANAPYPTRILGSAFAIGDTGFYGLGQDSTGNVHNNFDKFNAPDSCNEYAGYNTISYFSELSIYPNPFNTECIITLSDNFVNPPIFTLSNIEGVKQKIVIQGANSYYTLTNEDWQVGSIFFP